MLATTVRLACSAAAARRDKCRLNAKVEPLSTQVTLETSEAGGASAAARGANAGRGRVRYGCGLPPFLAEFGINMTSKTQLPLESSNENY
jgi:hypothetical protein